MQYLKSMKNQSAIFTRRSIRQYDCSKPASVEQIKDVLKSAMYAPSAMDKRPWEFVVATQPDKLKQIVALMPYCDFVAASGTAIIVCADTEKEFVESGVGYHPYDCSAAAQNILLRAKEIGLGSCWCGIEPDKARMDGIRKIFSIPNHIVPMALIALGTPLENPELKESRFDENKIHLQGW